MMTEAELIHSRGAEVEMPALVLRDHEAASNWQDFVMNKVQVNHLWPVILIKMTPDCVPHHCPALTECLSLRENRLAKGFGLITILRRLFHYKDDFTGTHSLSQQSIRRNSRCSRLMVKLNSSTSPESG